jgi:hypothetical protein
VIIATQYVTKVLLYDRLVGQESMELVEVLDDVVNGMQKWHIEQTKGYHNNIYELLKRLCMKEEDEQ